MASRKLRLAVIFSQETFDLPNVEDRTGNDVNLLESALNEVGFSVRMFENQKKQEILSTLKDITAETHKNLECILVIVLSHGDNGGVLFARDQEFYTKDVWEPFRDSAKFDDIPKIFIFQACRGCKEEKTFQPSSPNEPKISNSSQTVPVLPNKSGFLLVHSTIAGHFSKRNLETGTVFIQTLCNEMSVFHNKYGEINFTSLLTEVNNKVITSANRDNGSQTSTFTSFLRQPLILKTNNTLDDEKSLSPASQVNNDAAGGVIKTSYDNKGSNLILILYTEMYEEQHESLNRLLNHQYFTVKSILVNNIDDINWLSRRNNFENASSLTVLVLAEIFAVKVTDYCENLFVEFSKFKVHLNDIWSQFTAAQCAHLRGKPKLFFFFDLLERKDSPKMNSFQSFENAEPINNHSDFIWTYCYGKGIFNEIKRALTDSCEDITQLLTTAMRRADSTTGARSSHFESTLRLQFYFRSLTQEPGACSSTNSNGDTALHIYTRKGDLENMQLILNRDQSLLNMQNDKGNTPLYSACFNGKTEAVKLLLSHSDCSVDICNPFGDTVLHAASLIGYVEIIQHILRRDQSLLNKQNNNGRTPLYIASLNGKTGAVKFLLSHNDCLVNIRDKDGKTALDIAREEGHGDIIQLLLQHCA